MSAEVIAADLGLDLYTVNLATVVDKYVGETEKNLERIFAEAGGVNAVLFFDEADAIFGKRSEVRDAHDRYANIESAYLLQRLETFDGLAVLATNLRANIDEAFTRRLDAIIDFPAPDPGPARGPVATVPRRRRCRSADDVDVDVLRRVVRAGRRQHPVGGHHRGVPRRRGARPGDDGARDRRRRRRSTASSGGWCWSKEFGRYLRPAGELTYGAAAALSGTCACTVGECPRPSPSAAGGGCWCHTV